MWRSCIVHEPYLTYFVHFGFTAINHCTGYPSDTLSLLFHCPSSRCEGTASFFLLAGWQWIIWPRLLLVWCNIDTKNDIPDRFSIRLFWLYIFRVRLPAAYSSWTRLRIPPFLTNTLFLPPMLKWPSSPTRKGQRDGPHLGGAQSKMEDCYQWAPFLPWFGQCQTDGTRRHITAGRPAKLGCAKLAILWLWFCASLSHRRHPQINLNSLYWHIYPILGGRLLISLRISFLTAPKRVVYANPALAGSTSRLSTNTKCYTLVD